MAEDDNKTTGRKKKTSDKTLDDSAAGSQDVVEETGEDEETDEIASEPDAIAVAAPLQPAEQKTAHPAKKVSAVEAPPKPVQSLQVQSPEGRGNVQRMRFRVAPRRGRLPKPVQLPEVKSPEGKGKVRHMRFRIAPRRGRL
jgi:hypothetical protein